MGGMGITYDTGFVGRSGRSTREPFSLGIVRREMQIIRADLHRTAVRVTGGHQHRLEIAAQDAAEAGLEVWCSRFTCDLTTDELLDFLADSADRGERLRQQGAAVKVLEHRSGETYPDSRGNQSRSHRARRARQQPIARSQPEHIRNVAKRSSRPTGQLCPRRGWCRNDNK